MFDEQQQYYQLHEPALEEYIELIMRAFSRVEPAYYRLITTYKASGIVRERIFCYELYHQMRLLMRADFPLFTGPGGGMFTGPAGGAFAGPGGGMFTGPGGGLFAGPGGGLFTGPGGGLFTGPGGGLFTGPGGGMFTGPDSNPYMSNIPPWPVFVKYLFEHGHSKEAEMISKYLK